MRYGSLFAGAGGMDLGFDAAGWSCAWQVEIDPKCHEVLARTWPDATRYFDVCTVNGADLEPVDVIGGGSPCTDLSVAGRRAGLEGSESGLWWEMHRIIKEMLDATGRAFPRLVVWENVPGALTSNNGADFGVILDSLADLGALAIEWRVVDAQHFGPPQRRRRVFVVARFDSGTEPAPPILADTTGSSRGADEVRPSRQIVATLAAQGATGGFRLDAEGAAGGHLIAYSVYPEGGQGANLAASSIDVAPSLVATQSERGVHLASDTGCRRLTPLECERLMGWPDNHTAGVAACTATACVATVSAPRWPNGSPDGSERSHEPDCDG
jgi:DNA (cytosine-5)-methyltransferase 1